MKRLILIMALLLAGCGTYWEVEYHPETVAERQCVQRVQTEILTGLRVQSLAGHDQDFDDAISATLKSARETCCERRLYEYAWFQLRATGRIKEVCAL